MVLNFKPGVNFLAVFAVKSHSLRIANSVSYLVLELCSLYIQLNIILFRKYPNIKRL